MSSINIEEFAKISKQQAQEQAELYDQKRKAERSEDLQKFSEIIEKCVESKIESAINPVIERQNDLEKKTSDLSEELASLRQLVVEKVSEPRTLQPQILHPSPGQAAGHTPSWPQASVLPAEIPILSPHGTDASLKQRFESGRLTLGFEPIDIDDLDRISRVNDILESEYVMKLAVIEYLRFDMNVKTLDTSNIVRVFTQPNKAEQDCLRLYAQFDNMTTVNLIWQHVNRLKGKPDHHVMIYVPASHQEQYSHLNTLGYPYRKPQHGMEKCSTRVRYGRDSLYLQFKPRSGNSWTTINAPNLPQYQE